MLSLTPCCDDHRWCSSLICIGLLHSFKQMEFELDVMLERKWKRSGLVLKCLSILQQQGEMECTVMWNMDLFSMVCLLWQNSFLAMSFLVQSLSRYVVKKKKKWGRKDSDSQVISFLWFSHSIFLYNDCFPCIISQAITEDRCTCFTISVMVLNVIYITYVCRVWT